MRTRIAGLLVAAAMITAAPIASAPASSAGAGGSVVAAKSCSAGYVHARMPSGHKCLRAGQFCSRKRSFQRVYHRKGFHCKRNRHLGYR